MLHTKMSNPRSNKKKRKRKGTRSKGPELFCNFGKKSEDILTAGYIEDQIFSISVSGGHRVTLASNAANHGGVFNGGVAARYNDKDSAISFKVESTPHISTTLKLSRMVLPFLQAKASLKLPDYKSSTTTINLTKSREFLPSIKAKVSFRLHDSNMLKVQYFHECAALAIYVALNRSPGITLSASVGTSSIALGMGAEYKTTSGQFSIFDAGISMKKPNYDVSVIMADKGDILRASYIHYFDDERDLAAGVEISRTFSKRESTFIVGGSCIVNDLTTVKARLDNSGKIKTLLQQKIQPKSYLRVTGEIDSKALGNIPRFGLALALVL